MKVPKQISATSVILALVFGLLALAPAAALAEGPAMSALNPNAPAPVGFIAPTLEGDWRFRVAFNGWIPNAIEFDAGGSSVEEDLGWLLDNLKYYLPIDFEARKGSFGAYFHTLFMGLGGTTEVVGPVTFTWENNLFLFDIGLSYELGRWRLGEGERAPEITIEPFFEARVILQPVDLTILGVSTSMDLSSTVPVIGLRTFIDLTEHWNLKFHGDYGGFGVDDNHQTWQGVALIGYRWPGWGAHWNFQVGYRAMGLFDLREEANVAMRARGANIILGVEF